VSRVVPPVFLCNILRSYTEGAQIHDPGETGVYKKDFKKAEVFAAPSVPNIRSNDSTIQVRRVAPLHAARTYHVPLDQDERLQIRDHRV
jgi:hypothetical protein